MPFVVEPVLHVSIGSSSHLVRELLVAPLNTAAVAQRGPEDAWQEIEISIDKPKIGTAKPLAPENSIPGVVR